MIHFHKLTVSDIQRETDDTVSIAFYVPEELQTLFHYQAGQYLTMRTHVDGEEVRRSYSLCSAPHENIWRVAVKEVPGGHFSTWANRVLQVGETIEVMPPQGRFVAMAQPNSARHFILFAAGSGITPILAIIKTILEQEPNSQVTLFYGNRRLRSVIFLEELENLKNRHLGRLSLHFVFSQEAQSSPLFEGRIDAARCTSLVNQFVTTKGDEHYYICGPEEMIRDVMHALKEQGVAEERIHFELFTTPVQALGIEAEKVLVEKGPVSSNTAKIQVQLDGRIFGFDLPYNGVNILDASMVTGADLPFSCKGGVCCTCRAKLVTGEVHMDANYALEPWEIEEGFILTCQSHPRTPEVFVDFDQQ